MNDRTGKTSTQTILQTFPGGTVVDEDTFRPPEWVEGLTAEAYAAQSAIAIAAATTYLFVVQSNSRFSAIAAHGRAVAAQGHLSRSLFNIVNARPITNAVVAEAYVRAGGSMGELDEQLTSDATIAMAAVKRDVRQLKRVTGEARSNPEHWLQIRRLALTQGVATAPDAWGTLFSVTDGGDSEDIQEMIDTPQHQSYHGTFAAWLLGGPESTEFSGPSGWLGGSESSDGKVPFSVEPSLSPSSPSTWSSGGQESSDGRAPFWFMRDNLNVLNTSGSGAGGNRQKHPVVDGEFALLLFNLDRDNDSREAVVALNFLCSFLDASARRDPGVAMAALTETSPYKGYPRRRPADNTVGSPLMFFELLADEVVFPLGIKAVEQCVRGIAEVSKTNDSYNGLALAAVKRSMWALFYGDIPTELKLDVDFMSRVLADTTRSNVHSDDYAAIHLDMHKDREKVGVAAIILSPPKLLDDSRIWALLVKYITPRAYNIIGMSAERLDRLYDLSNPAVRDAIPKSVLYGDDLVGQEVAERLFEHKELLLAALKHLANDQLRQVLEKLGVSSRTVLKLYSDYGGTGAPDEISEAPARVIFADIESFVEKQGVISREDSDVLAKFGVGIDQHEIDSVKDAAAKYVKLTYEERQGLAEMQFSTYFLVYAARSLKFRDPEVTLAMVRLDGVYLERVEEAFRSDEVCLAAVLQTPWAWKHVTATFRAKIRGEWTRDAAVWRQRNFEVARAAARRRAQKAATNFTDPSLNPDDAASPETLRGAEHEETVAQDVPVQSPWLVFGEEAPRQLLAQLKDMDDIDSSSDRDSSSSDRDSSSDSDLGSDIDDIYDSDSDSELVPEA